MLEKTINKVLASKFNDWVSSISDPVVRKYVTNEAVITGGSIVSLMSNEKPKDYDVYFKTLEAAAAVARYYVQEFNSCSGDRPARVLVQDPEGRTDFIPNDEDREDEDLMRVLEAKPDVDGRVRIFVKSAGVSGDLPELGQDAVEWLEERQGKDPEAPTDDRPYRPVFVSSNAITLSHGVQIVVRFFGEPEKIHETYDFVHTRGYWTPKGGVVIPKEVYEAACNKTLIYTGSRYPLCSMIRVRKFVKRGWNINAGQILKMAMQISELDLTDISVLEDQLIGVDSAFFMHLISQFYALKKKDSNWKPTSCYVMEIVDRVFG